MDEVWKNIREFEGIYQVSNTGRIRSLDRQVRTRGNGERTEYGREIKQSISDRGYSRVRLSKDGRKCTLRVHQEVAKAFIGDCPVGLEINHIDEDKQNNNVWNLEYVTRSENMSHGTGRERTGKKLSKRVRGTHKESGEIVEFESMTEAGRNGFRVNAISDIVNGRGKTHYGYHWEVVEND